jgi:cell shape-determining protein MreD
MVLRLLSIVFAFYAIVGVLGGATAARVAPVLRCALAAFGILSGASAAGISRRRQWAPTVLLIAGLAGVGLCAAAVAFGESAQRAQIWQAAVAGAALWGAFCALVSRFVRRRLALAA